jgi:4-alpha-glucanotransferase
MQVDGMNEEPIGEDLSSKVILPVHRYLARSKAMLMMVQLEDLFCQKTQANLPGTIDEYPNWRGKLLFKIEDWLDQGRLEYYAQAIERERNPAGTK